MTSYHFLFATDIYTFKCLRHINLFFYIKVEIYKHRTKSHEILTTVAAFNNWFNVDLTLEMFKMSQQRWFGHD